MQHVEGNPLLAHRGEEALIVLQAGRGAGGIDQHHQRLTAFAGEISVEEVVEPPEGGPQASDGIFHGRVGLRFRILFFVEAYEERIGCPFRFRDPVVQDIADVLQIGRARVQRAVRFEKCLFVIDAPEDPGNQFPGKLRQARGKGVDESLSRLEVVGAHHDGERRETADPVLELPQRDRGRGTLRQQLAQIGAEISIQSRGERRCGGEDQCSRGRDRPRAPHREPGETLPQPVASASRGDSLGAIQGCSCYPAPCRAATIAIASRRSASPASPMSLSMVNAGCSRMACV